MIRTQAAQKHLDPALIAAVIYAESKFDPRESSAGALGLMQIAAGNRRLHRTSHRGRGLHDRDLATPAVNVAYGSWYLRYLLDHYGGEELPAIAAYNAGLGNVDDWVAKAREEGGSLTPQRHPVSRRRGPTWNGVLSAQQAYRTDLPAAARGSAEVGASVVSAQMPEFRLDPAFTPTADQPRAIASGSPRA